MSAWKSSVVSFKYRLGELNLYERRLQMRVLPFKAISETVSCTDSVAVPDEALAADEHAYLMRCLPLPERQPVVRVLGGLIYYIPDQFDRYYIDFCQSYDEYTANFSSKTRSTIRRKIKKFEQQSQEGVRWERYSRPEKMREFFEHARSVSSRSYQERLLDAGLPGSDEFFQSMIGLAEKDQVRGYVLFDGERPVAYMYCPIAEGVLLYLYLGYDPDYAKLSVGTILHWYAFEDMFREGRYRYFDFTEGQSEHKRLYSTDRLLCGNVYVFPRSLGAWVTVYSHLWLNGLSKWLGGTLDKLGLKSKVRKLIRASAAR